MVNAPLAPPHTPPGARPMPDASATANADAPRHAAAPSAAVRLREVIRGTGDAPGVVRFSIPGTDYRIEAAPGASLGASAAAGQRVRGALHAVARKVWPVTAGGRFVEPVFGRPRRLQGLVLGADEASNALWVDAGGLKVVATLGHAGQQVADFPVQTLVTFSVDDHTVLEASPAPEAARAD